ncbi:hypothetical protein ACFQL1_01660 [Halomicroarcula sp. GCM10025709]|uniref:hypothetical protein n=1 Tax=Haloarcula TaxID=2237 RepID=UPI0024C412AA|nr:hypothetical protein [Halomicroarcula sp. YJ-61-S]
MSQKTTITAHDGTAVDVRVIETTDDGQRVRVSHPDDREWIVLVEPDGDVSVEASYRDGELADLETPAWLADELALLARPA